jgi:hypothetical protein
MNLPANMAVPRLPKPATIVSARRSEVTTLRGGCRGGLAETVTGQFRPLAAAPRRLVIGAALLRL